MRLTLTAERFGHYSLTADDGRSVYFQTDLDFPPLARNLGWNGALTLEAIPDNEDSTEATRKLACQHESTDGTIACPNCSARPSEFIAAAVAWLDEHDGEDFEDTGYDDALPALPDVAEVTRGRLNAASAIECPVCGGPVWWSGRCDYERCMCGKQVRRC